MMNGGEDGIKASALAAEVAGRINHLRSGSLPSPLADFESRYAEAQRKAYEAKMKAAAKREAKWKLDSNTAHPSDRDVDSDFVARLIESRRNLKDLVRMRLRHGFELPFDQHVAGRWRKAFREEGLRSEGNTVLKLFVTLVPKGGRARASNDKAMLGIQSRSKLLTLDCAYIELNKEFLGALRIDCDGVFHSPEHLLFALSDLVRDGRIPCLPHIIVGDRPDDGTYRRPHLIFLLPPGSAVWKAKDKRSRGNIVRLFVGVYNGLAKAMLDIGADPAAPALTMRMKNPLSPLWYTMTPNLHHFPTLSEYKEWVDTRTSRETLVRHAAAIQSQMGVTPSNKLFNELRDRAVTLLREWHFASDARIAGSRTALADHLHVALEEYVSGTERDDRQVACVVAKVADYFATNFDASKLQGHKSRGRILDVVENMTSVRRRQQAGADYTHGVRKDRSLEKLVIAYRTMRDRGEVLSPERLSFRAGVSRSTAYRHFAACQQICAIGCIDKKEGFSTSAQ
jgi:AraC-like DNA-binding protein